MKPHNQSAIGISSFRAGTSKAWKLFTTKLKAFFPNTRTRFVALFVFLALIATAFYSTSSASPLSMLLRGYISGRAPVAKTSGPKAAATGAKKNLPAASAKPRQAANEPILGSSDLKIERQGHTATKLAGGRVLIAGGENEGGLVKKSEIFDPGSRQFSMAARLRVPRTEHTATNLADGRVLVIGGRGRDGSLGSSEIFDPGTELFSRGPKLILARAGHTATALTDGRVLIAGGDADGSAEIFDPSTNRFSLIEAHLGSPRSSHSAVLLKSGKVLIAGGVVEGGGPVQAGEIFDPETMQFSTTRNMRGVRTRPTLRVLPDGKVQVIGGDDDRSMEMFNVEGGYFTAYAHITPESNSLLEILRAQTRAALIHEGLSGDVKLQSMAGPLDELLDRSEHSLTDIPEAGTALVAGGKKGGKALKSVGIMSSSSATVTTDKTDYAPGETVIITGTGWQAGETVGLRIHRDTTDPGTDVLLSATADANGNISNSQFVIQESDLGVSFVLTATGQTSGYSAQTTFTDGNVKIRTNAAGITFTLTWSRHDNGNCTGGLTGPGATNGSETVGFSGGDIFNKGVGNTDSLKLTASAFSCQGGAFINWTAIDTDGTEVDPDLPSTSLTICVPGFTGNGTREYVANYASGLTCPANQIANTSDDGTGNCSTSVTYTTPTPGSTCNTTVACSPASGSVFQKGMTTVTCTLSPGGATCSFTVTVNDNENPTITCPVNTTVECGGSTDPSATGTATGSDNCESPTITHSDVETLGSNCSVDHVVKTITRTWKATDSSGNMATCTQTITVRDTTAPVITCPPNKTVECGSDTSPATNGSATATDTCSNVTITHSDVVTPGANCAVDKIVETIARTWTATDSCGNSSSCTQTITVRDTTAPVITCPPNKTVECGSDTSPAANGSATATDTCSSVAITHSDVVTPGANCSVDKVFQTIARTWTATDSCGNASSCTQTITVRDTTAPVISCPANETVECGADTSPAANGSATATDTCTSVTITHSDVVTPGANCSVDKIFQTISRTWTATDSCGNSSSCTQTITVRDTTAPVITCPADAVVECPGDTSSPATGSATATDTCTSVTITHSDVVSAGTNCSVDKIVETIARTWTATDSCGNTSSCIQTITVRDTTAPVITCPSNNTVECGGDTSPAANGSATATDTCSTVTITHSDVVTPGANCSVDKVFQTIARTWTATDSCGNSSSCTQTISVKDNTAPTITCPTDNTVECGADTSPAANGSATATDTCSSVTITHSDVVTPGANCSVDKIFQTISRTWTATDSCGNASSCTQTITVRDTTAPVITCPADAVVECPGDTSPAATGSASATDTCTSVTITHSDVVTPGANCSVDKIVETIARTWTATDSCGNSSSCIQTITVRDTTAPVITCPSNNTVECGGDTSPAANGSATATDTCSTVAITHSDVVTPGANCSVDKVFQTIARTWTATDSCGNSSSCTQTISVKDNTAPTITCPANRTIDCSASNEPSNTGTATATDDCSGVTITHTDAITPGNCAGNYTIKRTWTATDGCGNNSQCVQTIHVQDTHGPTITCPPNTTIECSASSNPSNTGTATAIDDCSGVTSITHTDAITPGNCADNYTITRTWKATDNCGNSSQCVQTITVRDTTAPVIICPPSITVLPPGPGQPAIVTFTTPIASDNCDPNPTEQCTPPSGATFPVGTTTVTCTATDACGNTSSCNSFQVVVPACVTKVIVEANFTKKGSSNANKVPVENARVVMLPKGKVQAKCNLLDAPCVWTNLATINNPPDPVFTTGADGSVTVYSSKTDPNGWAIYIDMDGAKASSSLISLGTTKIAVANTDCAPTKRFTAILVADPTGATATCMTQRQQQITGSLLEITYPEQVEWDGTDFVYPFIFTSDSDWDVDLCAAVPQGYRIRGDACLQLFVANETKVIFYDVEDIGSPEPRLKVRLKVKHQGKIKDLDLDIPGVRKKNKK